MPLRYERRRDAAAGGSDVADGYVYRNDDGATSKLSAPHIMTDGTMLVDARVAKPGILRYIDADGNVMRELLPPEELHRADSLGTLGRVSLTLEHPDEDVTPDNVDRFGVGDVDGRVSVDEAGGFVHVKLAIRRADAIEAVNDGKVELSPGYRVIIDPTPGVHSRFGAYDAIQRGRIYNHVALVDVARGGPDIRLRADGAARQLPSTSPDKGDTVDPILIALLASLGVERPERYDSNEAGLAEARSRVDSMLAERKDAGKNAEEMQKLHDANEALTTKVAELTGQLATIQGVADAFKAKADAADAKAKTKADDAERERLVELAGRYDNLPEAISNVGLDKVELPALRKAVAVAHLDTLGARLDSDAADGDGGATYIAGILSTIPAKRDDAAEVNPYRSLGTGGNPAKPRGDGDGNPIKPGDGDGKAPTLTQSYFNRADAHFRKAARAGGEA
jgi:hypothetical protein